MHEFDNKIKKEYTIYNVCFLRSGPFLKKALYNYYSLIH